ncbi:glycosyltransferase [Nitratireductor rhodophyticola]|uniref:glycosyltransferase n=1 Tax=Nitratireductor rhodophyticola TaxID=2854036 RepID=UPI002AC945F5|nr:glycosyltransferase [Nitratireductor rhodophyticola]WPZ14391.1 glycosyltransferase [Nitratireductor rhodophyticola]
MNRKPVALFVANEVGSFTNHRSHLVEVVQQIGLQPVLMASPVGENRVSGLKVVPIKIYRFSFSLVSDALLVLRILCFLLESRPRLVHLINLKPYLYGGIACQIARLLGWRGAVVFTVPGLGRIFARDACDTAASIRRKIVIRGLRFAARNATVTFETAHDRDMWTSLQIVKSDNTCVTNGTGIDLQKYSQRRRYTFNQHRPLRVLFASRLLKAKGLDVFLESATLVDPRDVEMLVAGPIEDDPDAVDAEVLTHKGGFQYLGQVDDMPMLLASVDVVVLPSRYNEGIPRILIEAAAAGCVPIATIFPGSSMLIDHGETGFLLRRTLLKEQAVELRDLVLLLARDTKLRCSMAYNAARKVTTTGFSAEHVAEDFKNLYVRAINRCAS